MSEKSAWEGLLYGQGSANWYALGENQAASNALKGLVWSLEQLLDTPADQFGLHVYAANARSNEAASGLRNAWGFTGDAVVGFHTILGGSNASETAEIFQKAEELLAGYALIHNAQIDNGIERIRTGVNQLHATSLAEATGLASALITAANVMIEQEVEPLYTGHQMIEHLAEDVSKKP